MQMRKHSAQQCPVCQLPWQACIDQSYVHKPHANLKQQQSYAANWSGQTWDFTQDNQNWGNSTPRGKSPRSRQRPRSAKKTPRGQEQWQDHYGQSMQGKGQQYPPPPPPGPAWTPPIMMGPSVPMQPPGQIMMAPAPGQMIMTAPGSKGGTPVVNMIPAQSLPPGTPAPSTMQGPLTMAMPLPPAPPKPPEIDAKFWDTLRHRKAEFPPDIQQEITKREGARVTKDLFTAVQQMTDAREEYEKALLGRAQHLQAWKTFLAKAVQDWQTFAQQFVQHEQNLQERIAMTRDHFMKAKEDVDQARQEAGEVVDLTEEETPLTASASVSTVANVSNSIHSLTTSLQQLHADAAALEAEVPHVAKRPRTQEKQEEEKTDEGMGDAGFQSKPSALQPFGKAGQQ
eukprot:s2288_g7.t1